MDWVSIEHVKTLLSGFDRENVGVEKPLFKVPDWR